jgi:hypothetical protein
MLPTSSRLLWGVNNVTMLQLREMRDRPTIGAGARL